MKEPLSKVSDLTRISLHDLKKAFLLLKLVSLITAINTQADSKDPNSDICIDIPVFGKIKINEDMDFDFIPDVDFKKDIYQIRQNPESFLIKELKKVLKISDKKEIKE